MDSIEEQTKQPIRDAAHSPIALLISSRADVEDSFRLFSFFYYMCGGMDCLAGFAVIVAACCVGLPNFGQRWQALPSLEPHELQMWIMGMGGVAGIVLLSALAAVTKLWAGWCFQTQRKPWFCYFAAILSLASFPYGTVIGMATFVVLRRPAIRDAFQNDEWNDHLLQKDDTCSR